MQLTQVFGRRRSAEGNWRPQPQDRVIASYPRSGNTWLRFMVAAMQRPDADVDFATVSVLTPDIHECGLRQLEATPSPRFVKTHEPWDSRYERGVYVVRDPRAVLVSLYRYMQKHRSLSTGTTISQFANRFLRGDVPYGRWDEHVAGWLHGPSGVLIVEYGDLRRRTADHLTSIAATLGLQVDEQRIERAMRQGDLTRMRQVEERDADHTPQLRHTRRDVPFVRAGRVEGWREEVPENVACAVVDQFGETMAEVGLR